MIGGKPRVNEIPPEITTVDDICDHFASLATSVHGKRVPGYDEFGNAIDGEQEAYLKAVEEGVMPLPAVPASGAPNVLEYDLQRRPKIPYRLHPGHKRATLKPMSHPEYKARARANRNAYQFHKCKMNNLYYQQDPIAPHLTLLFFLTL
jgi:hypothetical protein